MQYLGEILSLTVAVSWTATALFADTASHRIGALPLNFFRMALSLVLLGGFLWVVCGAPWPVHADGRTWFWLLLSGLVGYVFGDYCLFNSYVIFGSRFGQLFMTLAPPAAGIAGWLMLSESLSWRSWLAMAVTLTGIGLTILARNRDSHKLTLRLPLKGVLFGIGAGVGQGLGLVLSKVGLTHYENALAAAGAGDALAGGGDALAASWAMPFAGTFIRAIAGLFGFWLILALRRELPQLRRALHDRKGMACTGLTTLFGPFLGVSLSLMAVQFAPAGIASTLMALTPVLISPPYALIHRQKISFREILAALIAVSGAALFFLL